MTLLRFSRSSSFSPLPPQLTTPSRTTRIRACGLCSCSCGIYPSVLRSSYIRYVNFLHTSISTRITSISTSHISIAFIASSPFLFQTYVLTKIVLWSTDTYRIILLYRNYLFIYIIYCTHWPPCTSLPVKKMSLFWLYELLIAVEL